VVLRTEIRTAGRLAAIDCGSNSTRLLVVDEDDTPLERLMRITRLAEGVDSNRRLDPVAIERTIAVLGEFSSVLCRLGVARTRMVATSAARDAENADTFLEQASEVVGVQAEMLDGEEEGLLAYEGATADAPSFPGTNVVIDIGGGSTELVVGGSMVEPRAVSLELGCVRLTERFLHHDPPLPSELDAASELVRQQIAGADRVLGITSSTPAQRRLIGLAGTVATLSMLDQGLTTYDRARVHHSVLSRSAVEHWHGVLAAEPAMQRARRPGMAEGRQDVIVGGTLILAQVMASFGFQRCLVSESDILDGLVASLRHGWQGP